MSSVRKLENRIKHYEWGSKSVIPGFLGIENSQDLPYAEMWMGTHKSAPSQVINGGAAIDLAEVCGTELPFLFKLIAIEKPLSIQAHPDKKQAEEGFRREEESGLSVNSPVRNYRDTNDKPEIICAVTPIQLMAGFREPRIICNCLKELSSISAPLRGIISHLTDTLTAGSLHDFFRALNNLSRIDLEYLCSFIVNKDETGAGSCALDTELISSEQWKLMKKLAVSFPGDPSILSPLYLNLIVLNPSQAVFIPAGVLHSYISGFGVELMTNSDNVLRGGLTSKHADTGELINILVFAPFTPDIIDIPPSSQWFLFQTPCADFRLAFMKSKGEKIFTGERPAICVITEGNLETSGMTFRKGESFFIDKGDEPLLFNGDYSLFAACSSNGMP